MRLSKKLNQLNVLGGELRRNRNYYTAGSGKGSVVPAITKLGSCSVKVFESGKKKNRIKPKIV